MKKKISIYLILVSCLYNLSFTVLLPFLYAEAPKIIKFATIAPKGSTWTNVIHDIDKEIQTKSNGRIRLKISAGGTMGDETSVIRKMRISQIHCAAFTSLGLANILPEVRILDLPLVYKNPAEIDLVKEQLYDYFYKAFDQKGYVLLGWSELGFISFFSKKEIKTLSVLQSTNMWLWEGDPLAKALFGFLGISPIPLSLPNVTNSIHDGVIDTFYGSPLTAIALNWFYHMKYMLDLPVANATGALLMTKKFYNTLTPDLRVLLKDSFKNNMVRLSQLIREDNKKSREVLKSYGIKSIPANESIIKEFKDASMKTCELLAGKFYPDELLKIVVSRLAEYRRDNYSQNSKDSHVIQFNDIGNVMN